MFLAWVSACRGGATASPTIDTRELTTPEVTIGEFQVQSVEARVEGDVPAEVTISVDGILGDACTEIESVSQERMAALVSVHITTRRPKDAIWAQVVAPHR